MVSKALEQVARRHRIRLILQFGSTVAGPVHPQSDLDLAVLVEGPAPRLDAQAALVVDLQAIFSPQRVDVAVINTADPLLLKHIVERCRLLHGTPRTLRELEIYAFKRYQDHRRFLAMEREYVARKAGALAK